jgi:hypothetical protein
VRAAPPRGPCCSGEEACGERLWQRPRHRSAQSQLAVIGVICSVCSSRSVRAPLCASRIAETCARGAARAGLSTAEQLHLAERINAHVARITGQAPPALPSAAELDAQAARADADLDFGDGPRGRRRFGTFSRRRGAWGDSDGFDDD